VVALPFLLRVIKYTPKEMFTHNTLEEANHTSAPPTIFGKKIA
jgi:hypothetical protein